MNITNEMRARIFAAYWGCKFKNIHSDDLFRVNGIAYINKEINVLPRHKCSGGEPIEHCQLVLKELKDISDEDAIEVARIVYNKDEDWEPVEVLQWDWCRRVVCKVEQDITDAATEVSMLVEIRYDQLEIVNEWEYKKDNSVGICAQKTSNVLNAYDYLRSKSYMLPFAGINLFDVGLAIKEPI